MEQQPDDIERQLRELGNRPVPDALLKNIQARIGLLTPEWGARQHQLGRESCKLSEGERGQNLAMALGHFQNALHVYTVEEFPLQRVEALYDAGCAYRDLSELPEKDRLINLEKAVTRYKEAQTILREHFTNERQLVEEWLPKLDEAINECYRQRMQALKYRADVKKVKADALRLEDKWVAALANYNQALLLYRLVESRQDEAIMLKNIGDIHCSLEHLSAAMDYYQKALACFKQIQHRLDVATVLQAMGDVAQARRDDTVAGWYYNEALALFKMVGDGFNKAAVLASIGTPAQEVDLYRQVGEANISTPHFRSLDEHIAVLDRPTHHESTGGISPDKTTSDALPLFERMENPYRGRLSDSLSTDIDRVLAQQKRRAKRARQILVILAIVIVSIGGAFVVLSSARSSYDASPMPSFSTCAATSSQLPASAHGIGVVETSTGECIGLSDGSVAFDIYQPGRTDSALKLQAAESLARGDKNEAINLLQRAVAEDVSDAEARIYLEDQQALKSGLPYVTLIIGTKITGAQIDLTGERRILQGAYLAQQEHNQQCTDECTKVRLLIANSGNDANNAKEVANQIVQAAHYDRTIIGVEGWSTSQDSADVVNILQAAHIPMVSSAASSDWLTGVSPYFFRIAPPDSSQGKLAAHYAMYSLHARRIALFVDPNNAYSASLAAVFKQDVSSGSVIVVQEYKVGTYAGDGKLVRASLQEVASYNPDLIFFAGYSEDAGTLLEALSANKQLGQVPVMGGDDLYNLVGATGQPRVAGLDHVIFTAFASPDEWRYVDPSAQEPPFFQEYGQTFAAGGSPAEKDAPTGEVILSYDAMRVLLQASQTAFSNTKAPLSNDDLERALKTITGAHAFQGVSGQIAFGQNGDPQDKAVVLLKVDAQGQTTILATDGKFLHVRG